MYVCIERVTSTSGQNTTITRKFKTNYISQFILIVIIYIVGKVRFPCVPFKCAMRFAERSN